MAEETANADVVQGALRAVFSEHRLDQIDRFFSPEFVQHSPYAAPGGRNELRQWWAGMIDAIPDVTTKVEQLQSYDDRVAVFRTVQGTVHKDLDAFGIKGNGQQVTFRVADLFAVRDGRITAHWEVADTGPLVQLAPDLRLTKTPVAKTGMLIRKPVSEVFEAIVNPEVTSKFWFSKGSGRLATGKKVQWVWESHDVSIEVIAKAVEQNKRVQIEWPGYSGPTTVEWTFQALPDGTTFVRVSESGWTGDGDRLVRYAADSTQGFTLMLSGLKALLEHNVRLNLTTDRYPKGIEAQVIGA